MQEREERRLIRAGFRTNSQGEGRVADAGLIPGRQAAGAADAGVAVTSNPLIAATTHR